MLIGAVAQPNECFSNGTARGRRVPAPTALVWRFAIRASGRGQSQRDCGCQPKVAPKTFGATLGKGSEMKTPSTGLCPRGVGEEWNRRNRVAVGEIWRTVTQGSLRGNLGLWGIIP